MASAGPTEAPVHLAGLLQVMEAELRSLHGVAEGLQNLFAGLLTDLQGSDWRRAQSLDLLTQRLDGLAAFLEALVPGVPCWWAVEASPATATVKLAALGERLAGRSAEQVCETIELF